MKISLPINVIGLAHCRANLPEPTFHSMKFRPMAKDYLHLSAMGITNHLDLTSLPVDSADSVHLQIEATRLAYAEVERHLADIQHMKVTPETLLDPAYLEQRALGNRYLNSKRTSHSTGQQRRHGVSERR